MYLTIKYLKKNNQPIKFDVDVINSLDDGKLKFLFIVIKLSNNDDIVLGSIFTIETSKIKEFSLIYELI
jgi:hypothetical protein